MKVTLKTGEYDYQVTHEISVETQAGERYGHSIGNSEPEDCIIGRDLVDGNDIIRYIEIAYEAGKNGEPLDIEYLEQDEN